MSEGSVFKTLLGSIFNSFRAIVVVNCFFFTYEDNMASIILRQHCNKIDDKYWLVLCFVNLFFCFFCFKTDFCLSPKNVDKVKNCRQIHLNI